MVFVEGDGVEGGLDPAGKACAFGAGGKKCTSQSVQSEIGIELNVRILTFPQLIDAVNKKKAPLFGFAWSSDYPDGENNLALFYGPNGKIYPRRA